MRIIDEAGKQLGVMNIFDAIDLAKSRGLDLIQVTEKVEPPVCRIADYGKYLYSLRKKEKKVKNIVGGMKEIRIGFNISPHDIAIKAKRAEKFLREGYQVKISLILRGRQKAMQDFFKGKIQSFMQETEKLIPLKTERELKKEPRGFTMIISRK